MRGWSTFWLVTVAAFELMRYDVLSALRGRPALPRTGHLQWRSRERHAHIAELTCDAVTVAACFYVKPVRCLQRAVCTARMLRRRGIPAEVVVAVRSLPFLAHAWVEINGQIVNESPVYRQRLTVLHRA